MCGIAGVLGLGADLGPEDQRDVRAMTSLLRHRGPDSERLFEAPRCVLGNTRLKIIDLSDNADLPMVNTDGTVCMAYNGEVTNFRELRRDFRLDEKYGFRSTSDSEVVLHLYEDQGIDCLRHLSGMFALALYDSRLQKAWIVRDQYGIRPLFFMRGRDRLYFASEIKCFLGLPGFDAAIDLEGIFHYFTLAYIPGRHTPFRAVEELPGARYLEIDLADGNVREGQYYDLSYEPKHRGSERELADELYEQMRDSVRRNLIADAPLGLTLSGGFDTSSILTLARDVVGERDIHTYSIVMEEPSFDESAYQRIMVDVAKPVHHEIRVGPKEVLDVLVEHMAYMDEPSGNGAAIPSYLLAREAAKDVRVLLSGEGGDETFTAYETYRAWKVRRLYRRLVPGPLRRFGSVVAHSLPADYRKLSFDFLAKRFTEGAEMSVPHAHVHWRYTLSDPDVRALMPDCANLPSTGDVFADLYGGYPFEHELDRLSALDVETYFINDLMVKNDRTIMAHSIETRFPYMDRILFDFASRIPADLRLKGLQGRHMQKLAMKGRMPSAIDRRKNMGLEMPHSLWFLGELRECAEHYFSKPTVDAAGFLDHRTVDRLWQEHISRKRDHGRALWCILNLLVWLDLFVHSRDFTRHLRSGA